MFNFEISNLEWFLLIGTILLITGIFAGKFFLKFGVPSLLLFLVVGMLAGSDGFGGIYFDDAHTSQFLGVIALVFILFHGGFTTDFKQIKSVMKESILLATLGVALTAGLTALAVWTLTPLNLTESFLLGAILSSTDAPAVFSVLRAKNLNLAPRLQSILELESGSNDPMAVFLTLMATSLLGLSGNTPSYLSISLTFFLQMGVGLVLGWLMAKVTLRLLRFRLDYEGLYPVFILCLAFLTYALIFFAQGSGFLGVYVMGLFLGNEPFLHKKSILKFGDGLSWLMQSMMFLILGLLVFPTRLFPLAKSGMLIAVILMLMIRPAAVFISLSLSRVSLKEKIFISWVGLKGAVPIILATFPLLAGFSKADFLFHMVFFIVLSSTLIQGTTLPFLARWLKLESEETSSPVMPLELSDHTEVSTSLVEIIIPPHSKLCGVSMVEARFPEGNLIALVWRKGVFFIPNGTTVFEAGDKLMILSDKKENEALYVWIHEKKAPADFNLEDYR